LEEKEQLAFIQELLAALAHSRRKGRSLFEAVILHRHRLTANAGSEYAGIELACSLDDNLGGIPRDSISCR
jgi:hypothetical protein